MKLKLFLILIWIVVSVSAFAQAPQKMSYQAVIRNSSGALVTSTTVGMRISILQDSESGSSVYTETQITSTNSNGLVSIQIGTGTVVSGIFSSINWGLGTYYIKTETDLTGGSSYSIVGVNQLMSVPYALFSASGNSGPVGPIGKSVSLRTTVEPPGNNCPAGGNKIQFGTDINGNNILDDSEINTELTKYVCNGAQAPTGNSIGDMQYWNGTNWIIIPSGTVGQTLRINALGVPQWQN